MHVSMSVEDKIESWYAVPHFQSLGRRHSLSLQIDLSRDAVSADFLSRAFSSDLFFKAKITLGLEIIIMHKSSKIE